MIDLHLHILPRIDDGSGSIDESVKMAKKLTDLGFTGAFCTSHYIAAKMIDFLKAKKASCLGGDLNTKKKHQHVLFELPFYAEVSYLRDIIFELKAKDLIPVLAHPERYLFVQKNKEIIFELKKLGVKLQSNYGSIVGQYGGKAKKIMKFLLKNHLVNYLGTDIHRAEGSMFFKFEKAEKKMIKLIGEAEYRKIIANGDELAKPFLNA